MTEIERFTTTIESGGGLCDLILAAREAADLLAEVALGADVQTEIAAGHSRRLTEAIAASAPLTLRVWRARELAQHWGVSVTTVRGWIEDGDLEVFNVGRGTVPHWRIVNAEALRFAETRRKRAGSDP